MDTPSQDQQTDTSAPEQLPGNSPNPPSGPVTVRDWKVWVDRELCIGAATCIAIAPHTFVLDSEAKAIFLETIDQDSDDAILDAARGCPTAAIFIENSQGERIYPS